MSLVLVSDMGDLSCCETCGSTTIVRPRELHAVNEVTCACCGSRAGTLGKLRARAERLGPLGRLDGDQSAHHLLSRL